MHYKALPFGLEINWDKAKIQGSMSSAANPSSVRVMPRATLLSWLNPSRILIAKLMQIEEAKSRSAGG